MNKCGNPPKKSLKKSFLIVLMTFICLFLPVLNAYAVKDFDIPNLSKVKKMIVEYHESGAWTKEVEEISCRAINILEKNYDENIKQAVVFDIDDTMLDNYQGLKLSDFSTGNAEQAKKWMLECKAKRIESVYKIYLKARELGLTVFFITGRPEQAREATARHLKLIGCEGYEKLIMCSDSELKQLPTTYKTCARKKITETGYHILLNIGDQFSDINGGYSKYALKLPNPMYFIP